LIGGKGRYHFSPSRTQIEFFSVRTVFRTHNPLCGNNFSERCLRRASPWRVAPVPKIVVNHAVGARACPELAEGVPRFWGPGGRLTDH
jgi:hypothetical protein